MVKQKSGVSNKDGFELMTYVFNKNSPKLKLANLQTQSGIDEQEGFMHIFMGATQGIRNPKAHEFVIQNDPVKALEYLSLASLLARRVDESNK